MYLFGFLYAFAQAVASPGIVFLPHLLRFCSRRCHLRSLTDTSPMELSPVSTATAANGILRGLFSQL